MKAALFAVFFFVSLLASGQHWGKAKVLNEPDSFLRREMEIHLREFTKGGFPPPDMFGLPMNGEFTVSGFGLTLSDYYRRFYLSKKKERQEILRVIADCIEKDSKGTTFSQFNILRTLAAFQPEGQPIRLESNVLWKTLSDPQKESIRLAADVRRMYDPSTGSVLNGRPTNYLGVAAEIASLSWVFGFEKDSIMVSQILEDCIQHLDQNKGWLNDGKPGECRIDRYHFEFIRFVWESAERLGRKDLLSKMDPWCDRSDELWMALKHPVSGASFAYGRSLQNTWEDVWEYAAWMLKRKARSPGVQAEIFSGMLRTWRFYIQYEYDTTRHYARMLDKGRGCYGYVSRNRIWGYSVHALGKWMSSVNQIQEPDDRRPENGSGFNDFQSRYFHFREPYGIWVIRTPRSRIMVPLVTGIGKPVNSDYQAIPFAEGFLSPPVSLAVPHLLPGLIRKSGKYFPKMELADIPQNSSPDSILLVSARWISQGDTLPGKESPVLRVVYRYRSKDSGVQFRMRYSLEFPSGLGADSLEYGIWMNSPDNNPYFPGSQKPELTVMAPGFKESLAQHSPASPEGKGAFLPLPGRRQWKTGFPSRPGNLNWRVDFLMP